MPTGGSELGGDVGDLNEMAHAARGALGQNETGTVVEGGFGFEINDRHAARLGRGGETENLAEGRFVERENDARSGEDFAGFENRPVAIEGADFGIEAGSA